METLGSRSWMLGSVLLLTLVLTAASGRCAGSNYSYGEVWWEEYVPDRGTSILLHFGRPRPRAAAAVAQKIKQQKQDSLDNLDIGTLDDDGGDLAMGAIEEMKAGAGAGPIDDKNVPPDLVLDYSNTRRELELPAGYAKVPEGRFGAGLRCEGGGKLRTDTVDTGRSMECWFRIEAYPEKPSCILSIGKDEGRILLLPDGRLELKRRLPHGHVGKKFHPEDKIEQILASDPRIVSPDPVPLKTWTHVVAYTHYPIVQGAGQPHDARLMINGEDVAHYHSELNNAYNFMLRGGQPLIIGNSFDGKQPFAGWIDEVRVSHRARNFHQRQDLAWRDAARALHFDKPYFRRDGTVFHASLDKGLALDRDRAGVGKITLDLPDIKPEKIEVPGIRGKGWVLDPAIELPQFPLKGMNALDGSCEFWLRPTNWDNTTGFFPTNRPKHTHLTVIRFFGKDKRSGKVVQFMRGALPRAQEHGKRKVLIDPGHWLHVVVTWTKEDLERAFFHVDGRWFSRIWREKPDVLKHIEPLYARIGISDRTTVAHGERPCIEIDEVVGYDYALDKNEIEQAHDRWRTEIEPIKLYHVAQSYKFSVGKLEYDVVPKLPGGVKAGKLRGKLLDAAGGVVVPEREFELTQKGKYHLVMRDHEPLPYGKYTFAFTILDQAGKPAAEGEHLWDFKKEPWRDCKAGIIDYAPPPWTPIEVQGNRCKTRMSEYVLGENGLPARILADGENLLAAPVTLLENGKPMKAEFAQGENRKCDATWRTTFTGRTCTVKLDCLLEYDGMLRFAFDIQPKDPKTLGALTMTLPIKSAHATHYFYNKAGTTGVKVERIKGDGTLLDSWLPKADWREWRAFVDLRKKKPDLEWDAYWRGKHKDTKAYGFFTQIDVNDLDRGLYWFADHGGGWGQSKTVPAQELVRAGETTKLILRLVAEEGTPLTKGPIVFAMIPHPARPLMEKYRLLGRASPEKEPLLCDLYGSVFRPWVHNPKAKEMGMFPATDPEKPEAGPSWEYAQSCIPHMKNEVPRGYRTFYMSNYFYSCRAGRYDGWEWRSGPGGRATLSQSFVDYLCWEMNEWIGRGIFTAIYLDDSYEAPTYNVEAGQAVRMPDGSVQAGQTLWGYRQLLKRWRNIFHQHGLEPMLTTHHTRSWMYCGAVFTDSHLDGEGHPTITANSRDFVDSLSLARAEVLQNGPLWGVESHFMPSIWEGGLGKGKGWNPHKVWSWRMARGAVSVLAHFENGMAYYDQGGGPYKNYWNDVLRWGAGDPRVAFHPYYRNDAFLEIEGEKEDLLVSFYHDKNRVLLIASNRTDKPRTVKIKLDRQKLGLPANPSVKSHDAGYRVPPGEDLLRRSDMPAGDATAAVEDLMGDDALEMDPLADDMGLGEGEGGLTLEAKTGKQEAQPRMEKGVLVLPIRPKDFRMVAIE